ncbi:MAG: prepilin-type N-terminal cleavage/methylation domain-containing protein [Clostridiales bacterium]|nr:prepilin-type N-terminal cleavage/methylation domain-containing protein [Clostridiales bacterium]
MAFKILKSKKGFTLVEILIVIIIIGVLVAIAVPKFVEVATNAEHAVLKYNSTYLVKIFALNIYRYEGENRYADIGSSDGLNNYLEDEIEGTQVEGNEDNIKNPRSRSKKILHSDAPISTTIDEGKNPAVFITGNSSYSYTGTGSTVNLIGSIVAYINQSEPYNVQVYYIDKDGLKSVKIADFD